MEEYNRYRSPEVVAKILSCEPEEFMAEFRGPFCGSCGMYDYFEDLVYELKRWIEDECGIVDVKEERGVFVVRYRFRHTK